MAQEKVFSDTFSTTALAVYESFESAETLANMDLHQLTEFIIKKGKNRFPDPDSVAKAIQKAARSSYRLSKTVNDSVNQVLSISINSMRAMESQIKAFDKAIAEQMALIPNPLTSVNGIGPVYSAGIIGKSVISIGSLIRPHWPNTLVLCGHSISPVTLRRRTHA